MPIREPHRRRNSIRHKAFSYFAIISGSSPISSSMVKVRVGIVIRSLCGQSLDGVDRIPYSHICCLPSLSIFRMVSGSRPVFADHSAIVWVSPVLILTKISYRPWRLTLLIVASSLAMNRSEQCTTERIRLPHESTAPARFSGGGGGFGLTAEGGARDNRRARCGAIRHDDQRGVWSNPDPFVVIGFCIIIAISETGVPFSGIYDGVSRRL